MSGKNERNTIPETLPSKTSPLVLQYNSSVAERESVQGGPSPDRLCSQALHAVATDHGMCTGDPTCHEQHACSRSMTCKISNRPTGSASSGPHRRIHSGSLPVGRRRAVLRHGAQRGSHRDRQKGRSGRRRYHTAVEALRRQRYTLFPACSHSPSLLKTS